MPTGRRVPSGGQLGRNTLNAYAAGLLDGEGCIRWNHSPSVEVTNKHYGVLVQMQERWGGTIRSKGPGVFVWTLFGRKAIKYLGNVCRYSIIKYPQIAVMFEVVAAHPSKRKPLIAKLKRLKNVYTH